MWIWSPFPKPARTPSLIGFFNLAPSPVLDYFTNRVIHPPSATVGYDVFPVQINQAALVGASRIKLRPEFWDTVKVSIQKRRNFLVVDRHQRSHRSLYFC